MIDLKAALAGSRTLLPADFAQLTLQALRINNMVKADGKAWVDSGAPRRPGLPAHANE